MYVQLLLIITVHYVPGQSSKSDDDHPTVIAIPDDDQPCSDAECDDNGGSSVLLQEDSPRLQAATDISHPEESSSVSLSPSPLPPAATGTSLPAESSSASPSPSALDVGVLLSFGNIHSLDQAMKLKLIKQTPDTKFKYPTKYIHGCNRRFKPEWVQTHSWLHYSICEDSVYCKACVLFAPTEVKQQQLGLLVTKPFSLGQSSLPFLITMKNWHTITIPWLEWLLSKRCVQIHHAMLLPYLTKHIKSKYLEMHK